MNNPMPSVAHYVKLLKKLKKDEISKLSTKSGISDSTIWKIRCGQTRNPGYETLRSLIKNLPKSVAVHHKEARKPQANVIAHRRRAASKQ